MLSAPAPPALQQTLAPEAEVLVLADKAEGLLWDPRPPAGPLKALEDMESPDPDLLGSATESALPLLLLMERQGRYGEAIALIQRGQRLGRRLQGQASGTKEIRESLAGPATARLLWEFQLKARLRRLVPEG